MRCEPGPKAFRPVEPRAGERQELSQPTAKPRKMPSAAHIGEQANARFRHGKAGIFRRNAEFARLRDAHAAAHGDAVHESHDRLFIGEHLMVELVLVMKELAAGYAAIIERGIAQQVDVASRTETAPFGMVEDDCLRRVIIRPFAQRRAHRVAHVERERMQRLGPVERELARRAFDGNEYFVSHKELRSCRAWSRHIGASGSRPGSNRTG